MIAIPDITVPITFIVNGHEIRVWPVDGQILADARNKAIEASKSETFLEWEMRDERGISLSPVTTATVYSGAYVYVTSRVGASG
jgi:hypothetical protein